MRYARSIAFLSVVTAMMTTASLSKADLNSPDYAKAKALYKSNKLREAGEALIAYEIKDKDWLSSHLEIKIKIDAVIKFCNAPEIVAVTGIEIKGPLPPELP